MWIARYFKLRKIKKKREKAVKRIEDAVHAFLYLNRALLKAGVSRKVRKQLRRDLISADDPERILLRFLQEIKKLKDIGDLEEDKESAVGIPSSAETVGGRRV
jgi:hypothetical protein